VIIVTSSAIRGSILGGGVSCMLPSTATFSALVCNERDESESSIPLSAISTCFAVVGNGSDRLGGWGSMIDSVWKSRPGVGERGERAVKSSPGVGDRIE
jgi:hypothetical protein